MGCASSTNSSADLPPEKKAAQEQRRLSMRRASEQQREMKALQKKIEHHIRSERLVELESKRKLGLIDEDTFKQLSKIERRRTFLFDASAEGLQLLQQQMQQQTTTGDSQSTAGTAQTPGASVQNIACDVHDDETETDTNARKPPLSSSVSNTSDADVATSNVKPELRYLVSACGSFNASPSSTSVGDESSSVSLSAVHSLAMQPSADGELFLEEPHLPPPSPAAPNGIGANHVRRRSSLKHASLGDEEDGSASEFNKRVRFSALDSSTTRHRSEDHHRPRVVIISTHKAPHDGSPLPDGCTAGSH